MTSLLFISKKIIIFTLFIFIFFTSFSLKAQVGNPFITNYTSKEYKAHVQNWAITQDDRGIIYVGNGDGILEYDGTTWRLIPLKDKNAGFGIFKNNENKIYVGSTNNFGFLDSNSKNSLEYKSLRHLVDSLPTLDRFSNIFQNGKEIIFYDLASKKMFLLENDKIDTLSFSRYQWQIEIENQLYFWDRPDGVRKIENKKIVPIAVSEFYTTHIPDFIIPEFNEKGKTDNLLIYAREVEILEDKTLKTLKTKLYRIAAKDFETGIPQDVSEEYSEFLEFLKSINYVRSGYTNTVRLSSGEIVIFTTNKGVFVLNKSGVLQQSINEGNGLLTNAIYAMMLTDKENLFVAMSKGITHIELSSSLSFWDKNTGLYGVVENIITYQNKTYVATHEGLYYLENNKAKRIKGDTPFDTQTWAFIKFTPISKDGKPQKEQLLVTDNNGIHQITDTTAKLIFKNKDNVYDFYQSKKNPNRIFLLTSIGLNAMSYINGEWKVEEYISNFKEDIRMMREDKEGNLWLGTFRNGAIKIPYYENPQEITEDKIKYYREEQGFPSLKNVLVYDFDGDVVFATEKGMYSYDKATDKMIPTPAFKGTNLVDGSRDIFSFRQAPNGDVWVAGLQTTTGEIGVYKKQNDGSYQFYGTPLKKIPESMILGHYLAEDGIMWFGGSEGLFRYDPKADKNNYTARDVLIRKVSVGKDSVIFGGYTAALATMEKIKLRYNFNSVVFEYSLPSYGEGENQYRYRLKGYEEEWSEWTTEAKANYTNLYEGNYTFEVQGKNKYGLDSQIATYSFTVLPPIQRTWGAYLSYFILFILIVLGLVKLNSKRLKKENLKLENLVDERTSQLKEKNEEVVQRNEEINQQNEEILQQNQQLETQQKLVETAYQNVSLLSEVGKQITSSLSIEMIVEMVYDSVNQLLDASVFSIGIYNQEKNTLDFIHSKEKGETLPFHQTSALDSNFPSYCFSKNEEIIINDIQKEYLTYFPNQELKALEGELPESLIYVPIVYKNETIGVLSVQSFEKDSYTQNHLNLVRNIGVYAAIALVNAKSYQQITEQSNAISIQNENIKSSINYASRIQQAMLPPIESIKNAFDNAFVLWLPRDVVSGDFYWFARVEDKICIAAVDCTGHGVPGAFMSMIGNDMLNHIVLEKRITNPAEILTLLHQQVSIALRQSETQNRDGMDMTLCVFDTKTKELEFAGAKNPLYYIQNGELKDIAGSKFPIGGKWGEEKEREYENHTLKIDQKTTIFLCTDGYQDQFGGENGKKLMKKKMKELFEEIANLEDHQQKEKLENYFLNWKNEEEQVDDVLVMGFKIG